MIWGTVLAWLIGYDRLKTRGDRFFLAQDYFQAHREYTRATWALRPADYRTATLDALRRDCAARVGLDEPKASPEAINQPSDGDSSPFHPGIHDLFELAIAGKPTARASAYRNLGPEFESGYVALVEGDGLRASRELSLAARTNSPSFIIALERGRALSLAGNLSEAEEALVMAVRLAPEDVEGLNLLAAVRIELGNFEGARRLLAQVESSGSATVETTFLMGRALAGLQENDEALRYFKEAARREPRFADPFFEGGRILEERGDVAGAFAAYSAAAGLLPEDVVFNRRLATLVLAHGLDARAGLAACDRLMLADEERNWQYLAWIAELYVAKGWTSEARDPLEKAIPLVPADLAAERRNLERRLAELERGLPEPRRRC